MEHSRFTMGKVRQISADLDGFCCTKGDSCSGLITSKIHLMPFQWAGAFNPAVTIADSAVPRFLAVFA